MNRKKYRWKENKNRWKNEDEKRMKVDGWRKDNENRWKNEGVKVNENR